MTSNVWEHELDMLRERYEKERSALTAALLNGVSWESLKDQRRIVTELAIELHKKMTAYGNPAETQTRKNTGT